MTPHPATTTSAGAGVISTKTPSTQKVANRTCCDLCHIKFGAVSLGFIEALIAASVLIGAVQQVVWKNKHSSLCESNVFRDCLIFQFSHFDVTLIFDYIVILLMFLILLSVILLFCGVLTDTSCLVLPHIVTQAIFLLFSLGYFILYAWSYFYGDLYVHKRPFKLQSCVERMWLAALLLVLAALQSYLFSSVVRCSLYLAEIENKRRQRESAFQRCSERVRIAKENGLWRTTSWGGGFQQYKGQYDQPKREPKKKGFHVQWNPEVAKTKLLTSDENIELATIETVDEETHQMILAEERSKERRRTSRDESRTDDRQPSTSGIRRHTSESPKKDNPKYLKKTSSEGTHKLEQEVRQYSKEGRGSGHHHHKENKQPETEKKGEPPRRTVKLRPTESSRESKPSKQRAPLRSNKSVDSEDNPDEVVIYKEKHTRRRSSDGLQDTPVVRHKSRSGKSGSNEVPLVKKVSITATSA